MVISLCLEPDLRLVRLRRGLLASGVVLKPLLDTYFDVTTDYYIIIQEFSSVTGSGFRVVGF